MTATSYMNIAIHQKWMVNDMDDAICTFDIWPKYRNDSMIPLNGVACKIYDKIKTIQKEKKAKSKQNK